MGPSILVAPVFTGQKERNVVLPNGDWFDFYTGEYVGNGETINIETALDRIPLFVKDGGIIPMLSTVNSDNKKDMESIEVRHYGNKENRYHLYNDDGESFDYDKGEFSLMELNVERKKNGKLDGKFKKYKNNKFNYHTISWRWMTNQ